MEALGLPLQQEATLETLTEETVKSSEIEGEKLDVAQVRSSIARRLGMDASGVDVVDRRVEGVVEMMLDATRNLAQPLLGPHSPEGVNQEEIARRRGTHDERNRNPGSAAG
jgi:Fic family protein